MENQHRQILGYRELDERHISAMNKIKQLERDALELLDEHLISLDADPRWTAIAKTELQKAFMFAGRAVARPLE